MCQYLIIIVLLVILSRVQCDKRIGGGYLPISGEFPYVVLIIGKIPGDNCNCTGTILSERWVLTALMCTTYKNGTKDIKKENIKIYYGDVDIDTGSENARSVGVKNIITKEVEFHKGDHVPANGLALIETSSKIAFAEGETGAAILSNVTPVNVHVNSKALGFGCDGCGRKKQLSVSCSIGCHYLCKDVPNTMVQELFGHHTELFCPRGSSQYTTIIEGDYGAPLACRQGNYVCGVAYYGAQMAPQHGYQMIYIVLQNYLEWIKKNVKGVIIKDYYDGYQLSYA